MSPFDVLDHRRDARKESGTLTLRRLSLPSLAALYTTLLKSIFTYSDPSHVAPRPPRPPLRCACSVHVFRFVVPVLVVLVVVVVVVVVVSTPDDRAFAKRRFLRSHQAAAEGRGERSWRNRVDQRVVILAR